MKKNIKTIIGIIIGLIIGTSTIVGATTVFNSKDITYSSDKTTKTNVKDSLDELYNKVGKCPEGQYCFGKTMPLSIVELGDYISMTPTATLYKIPTSITGYDSEQTISPSELNLWRVIKKNEDGTIDAVSEYISSTTVTFEGKTGYMNIVGALNLIASQYTDGKNIARTRHMGYSNQIEKCTDVTESICLGDTGYIIDTELVKSVLKSLNTTLPNGRYLWYYLASRSSFGANRYATYIVGEEITERKAVLYAMSDGTVGSSGHSVRPIITIKSDAEIKSGDGKSASTAYQLS